MAAMSPRTDPGKPKSTASEAGDKPRTTQTTYERVALSRGYTVKAGRATRDRLRRGMPRKEEWTPVEPVEVTVEVTDVTVEMSGEHADTEIR